MSRGNADVAELADALVLGTSANGVGVRVSSSAPLTNLFELNRIVGYKNQSEMVVFFVRKNHPTKTNEELIDYIISKNVIVNDILRIMGYDV